MTLLTVANCELCKEVKKVIKDKDADVEIVEMKKVNGVYSFDGCNLPESIGFPILYFGKDGSGKPNLLGGKEGIISYITKGYVYSPEGHMCPYSRKACSEKKCVKFSVLYKGMVPEGGCSDYWTPILMTEIISRMGKTT